VGNRRLVARGLEQIREVIRHGIPSAGMPSFDLPMTDLNEIATFVHSLNVSAANAKLPGDAAAGDQFFFGKGQCASCHMVAGKGKAIGPDLTNVGRELTVAEIEESLLNPNARITTGYNLVKVELPQGKTLRGFARDRGNFEIQVQDLDGRFHLLRSGQFLSVTEEKESLMPPLQASPEERRDLTAFLSRLVGVKPGTPVVPQTAMPEPIDFSRILHPKEGEWPTYNGNLSANRYSSLEQIHTGNIHKLGLKWEFSIQRFGLEVTPIVVDSIMYVTGANSAFALDAQTGRQLWTFSRPQTPGLWGDGAKGTNRGVAILGDKIFMVTDNAHMLALNRTTGRLVWEMVMPEEPMHYGATSAPLVIKDLVISGVAGADEGIRGFIVAYKADTGELVWRHWTIPKKGEPGYETWKGTDPEFGGGSTWLTGSYDAELDTLFWPTGNPWPDSDDADRAGDNLYTNCILALDPSNGKLKWHFQFTPHDIHDWDSTEPPVLVDTKYRGKQRKLLLHADRNGFFYVLDRRNGEFLLGKQFVQKLTWASGIGPDGRPQVLPANAPPREGAIGCPSVSGATNWMATAFSPVTRLYYVMAQEACKFYSSGPSGWQVKRPKEPGQKFLRALDIETGKVVWEVPQIGPSDTSSGVLATAGRLVFHGMADGSFAAVDARDGKDLWHFQTNQQWKASPMTFMIDGKQHVAITSGPNILCFALTE